MRIKKILLPKWVPWFVSIIVFLSMLLFYYELRNQETPNFTSFLIALILLGFILFTLFFVSYRQIPYLILSEVRK